MKCQSFFFFFFFFLKNKKNIVWCSCDCYCFVIAPKHFLKVLARIASSGSIQFGKPIMETCLYNFDPLKPQFYIVKLGFTGVYIIFLISAQNIDCGYLLELPQWGSSSKYPQSMFWAEMWKYQNFYLKTFSFWWRNFQYIWIGVFS